MRAIIFISLLFLSSWAYGQNVDSFRLKSEILQSERLIKVWTPADFSKEKEYTVVYTLDAEWMFDITCNDVAYLSSEYAEAIPNTIVVGVFFEERNEDMGIEWEKSRLDKRGLSFKKMLTTELIPRIDKDYSTTGFNAIVGHSNSSTYINFLLFSDDSPFRGYIALSQLQLKKDESRIDSLLKGKLEKNVYYYLGSAAKDAEDRVKAGQNFEKIFDSQPNPQVKFRHDLFEIANHSTIALLGLSSGLVHIYQDYKSLDPSDEALITALSNQKTNPLAYLKKHKTEQSKIYGIEPKTTYDDLYFLFALAEKNENLEELKEIEAFTAEAFKGEEGMNFLLAQVYEAARFYDKAEVLYLKHLDSDDYKAFYAYYRPFNLYYRYKKDPVAAIKIAKRANEEYVKKDDFTFHYQIAKVSAKYNTKSYLGMKSIKKYIENYEEGANYPLERAYYIQAQIYTNTRRGWRAKKVLKEALKLNPDDKAAKEMLEELEND